MPRVAKLQKKHGYWYTGAGDGRYFGRTDVVPEAEARSQFYDYLKALEICYRNGTEDRLSTLELCDRFLKWVETSRSDRTFDERRRHLSRFCNFKVDGHLVAELPAKEIRAEHLEGFLNDLIKSKELDPFTAHKHSISVRAAFNWGTLHPSPQSYLSNNFRPFSIVEKYKQPLHPLLEDELITTDELKSLLAFADADLKLIRDGEIRRRRQPEEYRKGEANPYRGFRDLLLCYWHTGVRTSELAQWTVRDFQLQTQQIVLGKNKREKTMREPLPRVITANQEVQSILEARSEGKSPDDFIFLDHRGHWNTMIAAFAGKLTDQLGSGIEAPIKKFSDYEHLEAKGREEAEIAGDDDGAGINN